MQRMLTLPIVAILGLVAVSLALAQPSKPAAGKPFAAADLDFFEKKIRPVLVETCLKCHGQDPKKIRGGLDLTTREAILKGGDSGPAAVPGKPDESLLIQALRYQDARPEMPPTGMLPKPVIHDFEQWVKRGLPDPRKVGGATAYSNKIDLEKGRQFWSFQPLQKSPPPPVKDEQWCRNEIDRFLLARLAEKGLRPAADAQPLTLLRRLHFDLIGLPPTVAEMDAFAAEYAAKPQAALEKVVDRLLASPRFGERWGRHWLDLARYADSNGLDENLTFHEAWRYRDYVIAAFNSDKPYDRFVQEQIAGDLLPAATEAQRHEQMIATGFLVLGPKILAERDKDKLVMDVVDEQLDTTGRAILGLTLGCARCHDHKFDPIPTADYYALAGIFKSTQTLQGFKLGNPVVSGWSLRPLAPEEKYKAYQMHLTAVKKVGGEITAMSQEIKKLEALVKVPSTPAVAVTGQGKLGIVVDDQHAVAKGEWKKSTFHPTFVGVGYLHDNKEEKGKKSIAFTPALPEAGEYEVRLAYTGGAGRAAKVPVSVRCADGERKLLLDQQQLPPIENLWHKLGRFRFDAGKSGSVAISTEGTDGAFVVADAVQFIPVAQLDRKPGTEGTEQQTGGKDAKTSKPDQSAPGADKLASLRQRVKELEAKKAELEKSAPPPVPLAMAVADSKPADCAVCIRGNHQSLGAVAPRGFLSVVPGTLPPKIGAGESGRRELAAWLISPENPLPARVMVNRIWHHLFGQGIARTTDDFGQRGDRPSHPELLDYLAVSFRENGWSVKGLIRTICLSRAYRMSSAHSETSFKADPDNRLFWRMNRRRLQVEAIRDAMLAAGGTLDLAMGGVTLPHQEERAIDNQSKGTAQLESHRRSVYLTVFRNDVPEMHQVFDFVDPHVLNGRRDTTTVATQALFLMNSKFTLDRAQDVARRLLETKGLDADGRVTLAYRTLLGRSPRTDERTRALTYVNGYLDELKASEKDAVKRSLRAWQALCQVLFASTEFRYID